jgi:hypothetical protein
MAAVRLSSENRCWLLGDDLSKSQQIAEKNLVNPGHLGEVKEKIKYAFMSMAGVHVEHDSVINQMLVWAWGWREKAKEASGKIGVFYDAVGVYARKAHKGRLTARAHDTGDSKTVAAQPTSPKPRDPLRAATGAATRAPTLPVQHDQ